MFSTTISIAGHPPGKLAALFRHGKRATGPLLRFGRFAGLPALPRTDLAGIHHQPCASAQPKGPDPMHIFDRNSKRLQRERAALDAESSTYDYVHDRVAEDLADRLEDINRPLPHVLDMGARSGHLAKFMRPEIVEKLTMCEMSEGMLMRDAHLDGQLSIAKPVRVVADEEAGLPFPDNTFDAVISSLSLHWVNNLPAVLKDVRRVLKPDGVFLGCMFGGETLFQLRGALQLAEQERRGGFSPHLSPMVETRDVGRLLQAAGFAITTIDVDEFNIGYPSIYELLHDLRGMGESNATYKRSPNLSRDVLLAAGAAYQEIYGEERGIPATFQVFYMVGWKPDPSQPKSAARGSGTISLQDIDKAVLDQAKAAGIDMSSLNITHANEAGAEADGTRPPPGSPK